MQNSSNRNAACFGLALAAAQASAAFGGAALPDRPGFGDPIRFTTGATAEAMLPVARSPRPDRPGFGDPIVFLPGDPADALFPPGWVAARPKPAS
jgi:hypothetical protein